MENSNSSANPAGPGIEMLIKRAAVDPAFRTELLAARSNAAKDAAVQLSYSEQQVLDTYPEDWLKKIIDSTRVPDCERRAFLGKAAAVVATTISAGLAQEAAGAENQPAKDTPQDPAAAPAEDPMLTELKEIESRLENIRKKLQKEGAKTVNKKKVVRQPRRAPHMDRPMIIAGLMINDAIENEPQPPRKEEKDRAQKETRRLKALDEVLDEIKKEVEGAQIEIHLKKRSLE